MRYFRGLTLVDLCAIKYLGTKQKVTKAVDAIIIYIYM